MDVKPSPLISTQSLDALLDDRQLRLFDCRFSLGDPDAGRRAYLEAHIPGAVYLDLENDLSSHDGVDGGRHPDHGAKRGGRGRVFAQPD